MHHHPLELVQFKLTMSSSILLRSSIRSFRILQPITRPLRQFPTIQKFRPVVAAPVFAQRRHYAAGGTLPKDEVEKRIVEILKGFDKVTDPAKVALSLLPQAMSVD